MNRICQTVLFAGLASSPIAGGVERPAELDEKPYELEKNSAIEPISEEEAQAWREKKIAVLDAVPNQERAEQQPQAPVQEAVPYLGVGSSSINELLSGHLGIEHGVVVQQVHNGSGAFKAGLQKNDILTSFDGQKLTTPLDLRDAVRKCQVGEEVIVQLIRKGKTQEEVVLLEARPAGLPGFVPPSRRGMGQLRQVWPGLGGMPDGAQDQIDRLRNMIEEEFNGVGLGLKLNELLEGDLPERDGQIDIDMHAESSATWSDGEGTITMKTKGGQTEVQVRDNNGNTVYEGPWETAEDKAAVDPRIHDRIENMGVSRQGNQLKFWMEGLPGGR